MVVELPIQSPIKEKEEEETPLPMLFNERNSKSLLSASRTPAKTHDNTPNIKIRIETPIKPVEDTKYKVEKLPIISSTPKNLYHTEKKPT